MTDVGRLKIEEIMSGLTVTIPGEQHLIAAVYWGLGLLMLLPISGGSLPVGLSCVGVLLVFWLPMSWLLRHVQYGQRWASGVMLALIGLPQLGLLINAASPLLMLLLVLFSTWFWFMFVRLLSRPAVTLTIEQATVSVSGVTIPLEELTSLTPPSRWGKPASFGGTTVHGLAALRLNEWDWLEARLLESAQRRRATLEAEGHDLQAQAAPPSALASLTRSSP